MFTSDSSLNVAFTRNSSEYLSNFYPTALKGCQGIVLTYGVWMGRRAVAKSLSGLYLRNHKV